MRRERHPKEATTTDPVGAPETSHAPATDHERAERVAHLAGLARRHLALCSGEVRVELEARLAVAERVGTVPSLFTLMGRVNRELPYNAVLGWIFDPEAAHGAGRLGLAHLADRLSLPALRAEAEDPSAIIEVRSELPWPPAVGLATRPDLLVLSASVTLVIENKVLAGPSGEDQYDGYLRAARELAESRRTATAAWLWARHQRDVPAGWTGALTHAEVARVLVGASTHPSMTAWGRTCCLLAGEQLRHPDGRPNELAEARRLLRHGDRATPRELARMRELLQDWPSPREHGERS